MHIGIAVLVDKNVHNIARSIYTNGKANEPIPRHTEINELLAKSIIRRQGLE